MKHISLCLLTAVFFFAGSLAGKAQSLIIRFQDGSENVELLSSLQKLSFSDGNLLMTYHSGSSEMVELTTIQKLYFETQTSIPDDVNITDARLLLYPNPASNEIYLKNIPTGTATVFIYRMDGKLILQIPVSANSETFSVESFAEGFYLLVANDQTIKFIKL